MPAQFCKFVFADGISRSYVENIIDQAVFLAGYAFGRDRAARDSASAVADDPPRCLIDVSTDVGRYVAEGIAESFTRLRGDRSFEIYQADKWKL
ncbi:MAG: hypothetical protein P9M08_11430 [Candidatus Erginobacter occultus]|nr:hypothetical protein [Candidatus Erginobacter occultus]